LKSDEIDEIDRKILRMLQNDGRVSMKKIADKIGKFSKVAVSYRVRRLIKMGVIQGFYVRIDPDHMNQSFLFITKLTFVRKGPHEALLLKKIASFDGIQSVFRTFGDYDAVVIGRSANPVAARDLIDKMLSLEGISASTTTITHTVIKQSLDVVI
jgi:DNA-binding Lrp family transcriptional regulator